MTTSVSPERVAPVKRRATVDRFSRAEQLANEYQTWHKLNRKATIDPTRRPYLAMPGWPDRQGRRHIHEVALLACTCEHRQYARDDDACSHMLAARLWWGRYRSGAVDRPRLTDADWAIFEAEDRRLQERTDALLEEYEALPRTESPDVEPDWAAYDRQLDQASTYDVLFPPEEV